MIKNNNFLRGLKLGIPIGLGYLSVSFTFGIMAVSYGLKWWQALMISMTTLTSAGQFAGMDVMMNMGSYIEMLISQMTINIRYSFMSISLSQKVDKKFKGINRWILGFAMTDEVFAVAAMESNVSRAFFAGLATIPYIGWSMGTLMGALLGNVLPDSVINAFGMAIYGMFVAIVIPGMKQSASVVKVVFIAMLLSVAFEYIPGLTKVSDGLAISICAVAAAALGALLFPVKKEEAEDGQ